MHTGADEAARICARLIREGAVERRELPDLDLPEVRHQVEERLTAVGLTLATSAYSQHVGIRLSPEVTAEQAFDAASNLGLKSDACAMLVILWARLVLQKRTAQETRRLPGQAALLGDDEARAAREYRPQVRLATLAREFGKVLGSRSHIKALVTQLRRLRFLAGHGEVIEAGPFLELGIDGERMVGFIRREVLAHLLEERQAEEEAAPVPDPEARVVEALRGAGGSAAMGELARATGEPAERLRPVLHALIKQRRVTADGERRARRYHLAQDNADGG
jgi:hypothetical protein